MLRIIRTPFGNIEVDTTGKKSGRGAYLCYNINCFKEAIKKKRLSKSLKIELSEPTLRELEQHIIHLDKNKP